MQISQYNHTVTPTEINAIKLIGFGITANIAESEDDFLNKYFPNCDLFSLLQQIDNLLTPYCKSQIEKSVHLSAGPPPKVGILFSTDDYHDELMGLVLLRTFTWANELIVKHDFFRLPFDCRGKGIAKRLFRSFIQQYVNMGVKKIRVFAALADGGYVWAKNFFTADNKAEMEEILNKSRQHLNSEQFKFVERIYDNYYIKDPVGKAFPIQKWAELPFMKDVLRGSEWEGTIDLSNSEQFSNFTKYVLG